MGKLRLAVQWARIIEMGPERYAPGIGLRPISTPLSLGTETVADAHPVALVPIELELSLKVEIGMD